mmetsp:Transcript_108168/g.304683  ORF Transcript_108168/g.304683 Transcript_108168/m.304683 type:complete len:493 (-) Transcript_108168:102-1580(-)
MRLQFYGLSLLLIIGVFSVLFALRSGTMLATESSAQLLRRLDVIESQLMRLERIESQLGKLHRSVSLLSAALPESNTKRHQNQDRTLRTMVHRMEELETKTALSAARTSLLLQMTEDSMVGVLGAGSGKPSKSTSWPPAVCENTTDFAVQACRRNTSSCAGAFTVLCNRRSTSASKLWVDGLRLFGERAFVKFMMECRPTPAKLLGRKVELWAHREDVGAVKGALMYHAMHDASLREYCQALNEEDWVVDVGGHLGIFALATRTLSPECNIVVVEPSPWHYVLLRLNLIVNAHGDRRTHAVQGGVSDKFGLLRRNHVFAEEWNSKRYDVVPIWGARPVNVSKKSQEYVAPALTLPALINKFQMRELALMHLDCEGCEWEVAAEWLEDGLWRRIRSVVGVLNAVCPAGQTNISSCLPLGLSIPRANSAWRALCETKGFKLDWGCQEPKFAALGDNVAKAVADRICRLRSLPEWMQPAGGHLCKQFAIAEVVVR